jgi:hypothetical protein
MFAHMRVQFKGSAIMAAMKPIPILAAVATSVAILAACGTEEGSQPGNEEDGVSPPEVAGDADPKAVEVIAAWSEALRSGDIDGAAEKFAIPSVAENGPALIRIESKADARLFNRSLPCGGRLIRAEGEGDFTTATFLLTERPGPGSCGSGTGQTAEAAFVIRDGEILEWRRVGTGQPSAPGPIT